MSANGKVLKAGYTGVTLVIGGAVLVATAGLALAFEPVLTAIIAASAFWLTVLTYLAAPIVIVAFVWLTLMSTEDRGSAGHASGTPRRIVQGAASRLSTGSTPRSSR
jgi:hypothetical protein